MTIRINPPPDGMDEEWARPLEAVVTVGGIEVMRGPITGLRVHRETHSCANPECANSCLPDHFVVVGLREAPPTEPHKDHL